MSQENQMTIDEAVAQARKKSGEPIPYVTFVVRNEDGSYCCQSKPDDFNECVAVFYDGTHVTVTGRRR